MTEHMTVEELRAAGLAGAWKTTAHGGELELRRTRRAAASAGRDAIQRRIR